METMYAPIILDNKVPTTEDINKAFQLGAEGRKAGLTSIIMNSEFMDLLNLHAGHINPLVKAYNNGYRN